MNINEYSTRSSPPLNHTEISWKLFRAEKQYSLKLGGKEEAWPRIFIFKSLVGCWIDSVHCLEIPGYFQIVLEYVFLELRQLPMGVCLTRQGMELR